MKPKFLLLGLCIALGSLAYSGGAELKRLDPHGLATDDLRKMTLSEHPECKTCHTNQKWSVKSDVADRCTSCHSPLPHSGVEEHLGKSFAKSVVTCLSCHRPHRAALNSQQIQAQQFFKKNPSTGMMERSCVDCHKWPSK